MFEELAAPPLTTRSGLEQLYRASIDKPEPLAPVEYRRLGEDERRSYDAARLDYIHKGLNVVTPAYTEANSLLGRIILQNLMTQHDKSFLGISGLPYTGKSHLVVSLMVATARRLRREVPDFLAQGMLPCAYVTIPSPTTSKDVLREIANFYEYPAIQRYTENELLRIVTGVMRERRTILLCFDEAQNMAQGTRTLEDAKNLLRKISQETRATRVYSGIELRNSGLLGDISGRQLSERIRMIDVHPYSAANKQARQLWRDTVDAFELGLCLVGHERGTLRELASYLYDRTGGMMGELSNTLRTAAVLLISGGAADTHGREQITKSLIRSIPLSVAAQERAQRHGDDDEPDWPNVKD